ncbi:hypothetical protein AL755_12030 [Arthrobacter sp. ERGS1:01]|uniref:LysR family transcriptional regulator n=1 Tax=Arthrobacter sp. ERGS1:01 TaxID=1704044 RepID=UPI0006B511CE|nr:LysR family transcriptional regulator [Arthrobacter sp. ERGS1:01]ALE06029.1 hypothetical protein AL755_12030 [Arthrobacter sp. ERGS1:01]
MLSPRMPELSALEMLAAVHSLGSLSAAGKLLGLSQQGVSSRMKNLEAQIGAVLLTRTPRGSTLTETGTLVAVWAADVLAAAERLDTGISSLRAERARQLHVVASQTIAEHLLPRWLVALRRQQESHGIFPTVVELTVTNSEVAAEMVRSGAAAIGFIESSRLPGDLASATVQHDELTVVVAPGHPWARRTAPLTPAELAGAGLVSREVGSGTRNALEVILAAHDPGLALAAPVAEYTTTAAVRSAVAAGTGPGVLSVWAVRDDLDLGRLVSVPVARVKLRRPLTVLWTSGALPPAGPGRDLAAIAAAPTPPPR